MRILIITDAWRPQINGVVRTYEHLYDELSARGHTVGIIGPHEFPRRLPMPGYSEIELVLLPYRLLKAKIEKFQADHIHIATEGPLGWAARKYCVKSQKTFTSSYHTQFPEYSAKRAAKFAPFLFDITMTLGIHYVRTFHRPSAGIMVATPTLEKELIDWGFKNKMHRLTRGAKMNVYTPGNKTEFKTLKSPIALYVGRISIEKNIEAFLQMEWPGTKVLVGDGPARTVLSQKYPKAVFAGFKTGEELAACYRSADVFVFPSKTDTFGMVIIEALACGIPVAAYNVMGPKDILTQPFLGALAENDLAAAAQRAMNCGTGDKRVHYVSENYSWKKAADQFENAVQHCIESFP